MATYSKSQKRTQPRRYRSLGLSLSIIGAFTVYGLFPMVPAFLVILLRLEGHVYEPVSPVFWLTPLLAAAMLVITVFAWIGEPRRIRLVFLVGTVLSVVYNAYLSFHPDLLNFVNQTVTSPGGPIIGSSFDLVFASYLRCLLPLWIVVGLFILWYCNRRIVRDYYARR